MNNQGHVFLKVHVTPVGIEHEVTLEKTQGRETHVPRGSYVYGLPTPILWVPEGNPVTPPTDDFSEKKK